MKTEILILNVNTFEKEGQKKSRIGFIFAKKEYLQNTAKFKGYAELSMFYENELPFNNIPLEIIGNVVEATIREVPNVTNPLRKRQVIESIKFKDNVINLL